MSISEQIRDLISRRAPVHMMGICGVGMAGLARLLHVRGVPVSGCDESPDNAVSDWLRDAGIAVTSGHDVSHISEDVQWVIRSTAVPDKNVEWKAVQQQHLPACRRGDVLPVLLEGRQSVVVCGTHGKTTTASFVVHLLRAGGLSPAWCIGGAGASLSGWAGDEGGDWVVVEADESDGTLSAYHPDITILTNVDFDHMEHFEDAASFEACFRAVLRQTRRKVFVCAADTRAVQLARESVARSVDVVTYGLDDDADVSGEHISIPVPGDHNMMNATGAMAAAVEIGGGSDDARCGLATLSLPNRRFECVLDRDGVRVISDYAHHPAEIAALITTAREQVVTGGRLRAVFQPHRYTRTLALKHAFPSSFRGVDELVLLPVYPASEAPLEGGQSWDLYKACREGGDALPGDCLRLASSLQQAWVYMCATLQEGDMLLIVGAGDIAWMAEQASALQSVEKPPFGLRPLLPPGLLSPSAEVEIDGPLGRRTTFRVGSTADALVRVQSESDLVALRRWCHLQHETFRIHAAGSNVLVSDLGVRGVTAMLDVAAFGAIREDDDCICVGPACSMAKLLAWCETHGRGGLESLEGIPGSVGGAMRMNAGAWGTTFGDYVESIRCLNPDGTVDRVGQRELGLGYRQCLTLNDGYALEVRLRLPDGDPVAIAARRRELSDHRAWQRGLRSAGSVFKNPEGTYAAQLIDEAGLKAFSIGGASVLDHHANMMVADETATASDVLALVWHVRDTVLRRRGIALHTEMICLG